METETRTLYEMIGYKNLFFSPADEPTGNLDTKRSEETGEVLKMPNEKEGLTVLLVTHNPAPLSKKHAGIFSLEY